MHLSYIILSLKLRISVRLVFLNEIDLFLLLGLAMCDRIIMLGMDRNLRKILSLLVTLHEMSIDLDELVRGLNANVRDLGLF